MVRRSVARPFTPDDPGPTPPSADPSRHDMLVFESDAEVVAALEPFVRTGVAAGDVVLL